MIRLALCLWMLGGQAFAQTLPALHDVAGVATGDVLNIRAEPSGTAAKLGEYPRNAMGIEVTSLSADGRWGRVNAGEQAGWVAMRYLARRAGPDWTALQTPMTCSGTEPFWSLRHDPASKALYLEEPGLEPVGLWIDWTTPPQKFPDSVGLQLAGPSRQGFSVLRAQTCTDGMSDREMGVAVDFHIKGTGDSSAPAQAFKGCCVLLP